MICANTECAKEFDSKTHNQKYCSDECCRVATNRRIMEKYYEKKAIKNAIISAPAIMTGILPSFSFSSSSPNEDIHTLPNSAL